MDIDVVHERTLWRLRASVGGSPWQLSMLAAGMAALSGNTRTVQVHPTADGAVDEVLLDVPATVTAEEFSGPAPWRVGMR